MLRERNVLADGAHCTLTEDGSTGAPERPIMNRTSSMSPPSPCPRPLPLTRARCVAWAVVLGVVLWGATTVPLSAQAPSAEGAATYRQLVEQALGQYRAQHYIPAHALLLEAHRMWPNARTLRGLCRVAFDMRRYRDAINYCSEASSADVQPLDANLHREVRALQDKANQALARVEVEVTPNTARFRVDGLYERLGDGRQLTLNPGRHIIEASAPGYRSERRSVQLKLGERTSHRFQLASLGQARPPTVSRPDGPRRPDRPERRDPLSWRLPTGLSLLAVGALSTGFGIAGYAQYLERGNELRVQDKAALRTRWTDARTGTFLWSAVGAGALSAGAATLAPAVARRERRWLTPTLAVLGGGALTGGLVLLATNRCGGSRETIGSCTSRTGHHDGGALLTMVSAPLLTLPLFYGIEWLLNR